MDLLKGYISYNSDDESKTKPKALVGYSFGSGSDSSSDEAENEEIELKKTDSVNEMDIDRIELERLAAIKLRRKKINESLPQTIGDANGEIKLKIETDLKENR